MSRVIPACHIAFHADIGGVLRFLRVSTAVERFFARDWRRTRKRPYVVAWFHSIVDLANGHQSDYPSTSTTP